METNHPVLSSLIRLHADLGGQIKANKKQAERLAADMKHVEAVIKMYAPTFNTARISPKRRNRGNPWFKKGTLFRCALDAMREAGKPLTVTEMLDAMLAAKGVLDAPVAMTRKLWAGLQSNLRNHEGKAVVAIGEGSPKRWTIKTQESRLEVIGGAATLLGSN